MLPQYTITLGARSAFGTGSRKAGKFVKQDYARIEAIVRNQHGFQGCTIIYAKGFYQGNAEDTIQIIILEEDYAKVKACAQQLRDTFRQESVLVVCEGVGEFLK